MKWSLALIKATRELLTSLKPNPRIIKGNKLIIASSFAILLERSQVFHRMKEGLWNCLNFERQALLKIFEEKNWISYSSQKEARGNVCSLTGNEEASQIMCNLCYRYPCLHNKYFV